MTSSASEEWNASQKARAKWTKLETIVVHPERLKNLARDIVSHYEKRTEVFDGKAMIVTMRRTLNKYGYPPDKQQKAVDTILKQAEVLADYWVVQ